MKILFLSRWYPFPVDNGSKLRIYGLLQALASRHEVVLVTCHEHTSTVSPAPELRALCREIYVVPWRPFDPRSWRARLGYLSAKPRVVVDTYSKAMTRCIEQRLQATRFDLVIASQFPMAMYSTHFRHLPAILEELELGIYYDRLMGATGWRRLRHALTWHKHRRWLAATLKDFRSCTVVSSHELQLARQAIPSYSSFEIVPNYVQMDDFGGAHTSPEPDTLIFMGSFSYYPNYEAMCWFLREVFPLVQQEIPGVRLTITGNHQNYTLPPADHVVLTGYVDDVRPYVTRSWASLAPIHQGGGTRLKILESMALGTPVIATSKGAEGLNVRSGHDILIADSPQEFAQAVIRLLREPGLRQQLVDAGYRLVREHYDWKVVIPRFLELAERIASAPERS